MTSFYSSSRSNPDIHSNEETYSTIDIYLSSQTGSIPLAGYTNINAGFTCLLANPIILDIGNRYVMALIKYQFDVTQYTTRYYNFNINCDILEYQYQYNQKKQLLYETYTNKYTVGGSTPSDVNPATAEIQNVAWKFINPTEKVINRISFTIMDDTGAPLNTDDPAYPTKFNILIKKVNTNVVAVSIL